MPSLHSVKGTKPRTDTAVKEILMVTSTRTSALLVMICALGLVDLSAQPRTPSTRGPQTPVPTVNPVAVLPAEYLIGPEDVLGIVFWREPDMSGDVTVRPDGKISLPVIGTVQAAGLRPDDLQRQVQAAAAKYITDPNISIVVRTINSRKIFVTGLVTRPGAHALVGPLTVMQAIALSGGLMEYADAKNITILRNEGGHTETLKFNYRDVSKGKRLEQNIQLRPGDTVVIP